MMAELMFPPACILLIAAVLAAVTRGAIRKLVLVAGPLATLIFIFFMPDNLLLQTGFLSYEVALVESSSLKRLMGSTFVLLLLAGMVFAMSRANTTELVSAMALGAAAVGVVFAGDLLMLFLFWELMVIFSAIVIFAAGTEAARGAGIRYVIIQLLAGLILKVGIEAVSADTGSVAIQTLVLEGFGPWMIAVALMINAAAVPLSVWLTDAYPEATPTGTVFLAAFTTKSSVLASILLFGGAEPLILFGLLMIVYGTFYGLREDNVRRLLCYGVVAQVGFMLCGVGVGGEAVLNAVVVFAVIHVLAMGILLLSAAAVIEATGKERLSELGGLSSRMPVVFLATVIGTVGVLLAPVASGLLVEIGAVEETWLQYLLLFAATGAVLHGGLKYLRLVFVRKNPLVLATDINTTSMVSLLLPAVPLVLVLFHAPVLGVLLDADLQSWFNVMQLLMLVLLLSGAALVTVALRSLIDEPYSIAVDFDIVYRKWLWTLWVDIEAAIKLLSDAGVRLAKGPLLKLPRRWFDYHGPQGPLARTWATGSMLLWVTVILAVLLIGARLI